MLNTNNDVFKVLLAYVQTLTNIQLFADRMGSEAEKKFWGCPELVENLLPSMDTLSLLRLVQAHRPILDIVLGKTMWNKLIRKIIYDNRRWSRHQSSSDVLEKEFGEMRIEVNFWANSEAMQVSNNRPDIYDI